MSRKFETKNINEATPEEVRAFAKTFLGIPIDDDDNDATVLAKVKAAHEGETIFVANEPVATEQTGSEPPDVERKGEGALVGGLGRGDPKVQLTLHAEERDGVIISRHKEVGVNGVVWLLKRGESITIPYRVFLALNDAERHVITHTQDGEVREQVVKNCPFNIEKMPSQAEIDAWHAATDAVFVP